jgi:hypothetical protein
MKGFAKEILREDREDNIKRDFKETEWEGVTWTHLAQDRDQWRALTTTVISLGVP